MTRLIFSALVLLSTNAVVAQDFIERTNNIPETILLIKQFKSIDNLFGTHKLTGSSTKSNTHWFSNADSKLKREGYSATGFQNLHGMNVQGRLRLSIGGPDGFFKVKTEYYYVNRSMFDNIDDCSFFNY